MNIYVDNALSALSSIGTIEGLLFLIAGALLGLLFGSLPGLGGPVALALLIPITFGLDSHLAFIMMSAAIGGSAFGGSISAILLNIPGTAPNAATLLDGYPMSQKGQANYALGASAMSSAAGAVVGLSVLIVALPFIRSILRLFGPPEFLAMAVAGLMVIGLVSKGSLLSGIIGGCIGLFISYIGLNQITGSRRYTFDSLYLYDGVDLVVVIIGIFAISEMISLLAKNQTISSEAITSGGNVIDGIKSPFKNLSVFIRSSIIGVLVGMIPAAGGSVASFIAYVQASQLSGEPEKFGTGDVRGVIATESANDAKDGGALIPTIAFGIPGSAAWAVMLGAFVLHGIRPGPDLLNSHLDVVFILIFSLVLSNILVSIVGVLIADQLGKITLTPVQILAPSILIISMVGAYTIRFNIIDVVTATVIGIFGYFMIKYDISRIALIIGVVLGPIVEASYHQSLQISGGTHAVFLTRPVALLIIGSMVLLVLFPHIKSAYKKL